MNEDEKNNIALFRYGIIAPLVTGTMNESITTHKGFFEHASTKTYQYINGKEIKVSDGTIERWYLNYRKKGFEALKPVSRTDFGHTRKLSVDLQDKIIELKNKYPKTSVTTIYEMLRQEGLIDYKEVSLSTVNRFVNQMIKDQKVPTKEMKRYEKEFINEVWYGDTTYSSYVMVDSKKTRTYVIALMDDASRLIVGYGIFLHDNYLNLLSVIKTAIKTYGKPAKFSFDNGSNYKNKQMELLAARLGIALNYAPPYTPQSKGKIERWFKTFKSNCLYIMEQEDLVDIEVYKQKIATYINLYNHRIHSSLKGLSPNERFFNDCDLIVRLDQHLIDQSFLLEVERKVSKDNVLKLEGQEYEVDYKYCDQRIRLRYSPDLEQVYVVEKDNQLIPLSLLNKVDNSNYKRKKFKMSEED